MNFIASPRLPRHSRHADECRRHADALTITTVQIRCSIPEEIGQGSVSPRADSSAPLDAAQEQVDANLRAARRTFEVASALQSTCSCRGDQGRVYVCKVRAKRKF